MKSKTLKNFSLLMLIALLSININTFAQKRGRNNNADCDKNSKKEMRYNHKDLNLTEEQTVKIEDLRIACKKETLPLSNLLNEKRAHKRTLMTAEKINKKEIDKTIDEMSVIKTKITKIKTMSKLSIRNLLTDKQKVVFDSRPQRKRMDSKDNMKNGNGRKGKSSRDCDKRK